MVVVLVDLKRLISTEVKMMNKITFDFSTFRNGLLMGMADAVPGVSGGTIALILGIYNKLIFSLSDFLNFFKDRFLWDFWSILGGDVWGMLGDFLEVFYYSSGRFPGVFLQDFSVTFSDRMLRNISTQHFFVVFFCFFRKQIRLFPDFFRNISATFPDLFRKLTGCFPDIFHTML